MNEAKLFGRLGKDPEIKAIPNGTMVCNFSIATSEKWKDKAGTKQEKATWHNIVVWGKSGEAAHTILKKGSLVLISGKIENRSYDKDGEKRFISEVVVNSPRGFWQIASGGRERGGAAPSFENPKGTGEPPPEKDYGDGMPF